MLQNFDLLNKVIQQSHENHPSLNQVEVLNISYKNKEESLLNIIFKKILTANIRDFIVNKNAITIAIVIDNI